MPSVLIADDAAFMRMMLKNVLTEAGYEIVGEAENGAVAVAKHRELKPDLTTMDITMPQMDGIECISKLVELKPAVRILVISALADKATAVEAMEKGANGFLNKPFTDRQLNEAIADLIRE